MPNWVRSKIIGVSLEQIEPYRSADFRGEDYLDFNKIIPEPENYDWYSNPPIVGISIILPIINTSDKTVSHTDCWIRRLERQAIRLPIDKAIIVVMCSIRHST